jgi:hypothetical protein
MKAIELYNEMKEKNEYIPITTKAKAAKGYKMNKGQTDFFNKIIKEAEEVRVREFTDLAAKAPRATNEAKRIPANEIAFILLAVRGVEVVAVSELAQLIYLHLEGFTFKKLGGYIAPIFKDNGNYYINK